MIAIESGVKRHQSRANAVSALAEARISLENAVRNAPWRGPAVGQAQTKLEEAERQLQAGRPGTAIFLASRAERMANALNDEARLIAADEHTRFIGARRVNLRAGPSTQHEILGVLTRRTPVSTERLEDRWWRVRTMSGQVGWVHARLLK